jgi:thioredoxin 1
MDNVFPNNIMERPFNQETFVSDKIKHVTDTTFADEVLGSPIPVLVDYWAEWCGPCKMIAPSLDESAETYSGRLSVAKIDIDHNQTTPSRYHVRGIPTLMLFKHGEVVATKVGALSKAQLAAFIDANL